MRKITTWARALVQWPWAVVVGKVIVWVGAFMALAHVGTGAAARLSPGSVEGSPELAAFGGSVGSAVGSEPTADPAPVVPAPFEGSGPKGPAPFEGSGPKGPAPFEGSGPKGPELSARASPSCTGGRAAITEDGKVILNLADADDLMRLPGVGRKRAEAIIAVREKLGGRFRRIEDLRRVRGIGPRSLARLRPHVVLDPPDPPPDRPGSPDAGAPSAPRAPP